MCGFQSNNIWYFGRQLPYSLSTSHKNIHTNKFAFCLCLLVLYWSLQSKMAKFRMFESFYEVKNIVEGSIGQHRTLAPRVDTRPIMKRCMERLEVQNCLRTNWRVFVAFFRRKTASKWSVSSEFLFLRMVNSWFIAIVKRRFFFFCLMWKNGQRSEGCWR